MDQQEQVQHELEHLRSRIALAKINIAELQAWSLTELQEQALFYCLRRATDLAEGYLHVFPIRLTNSLSVLLRGLYETFLWTYWVTASDDNAQKFAENAIYQLKKITAKNLRGGYARIINKKTGEDATQEFLDHPEMQKIPRLLGFETIAKESGLERMHTNMYGILSMLGHGTQFGTAPSTTSDELLFGSLAAANALIGATQRVVVDWMQHNKRVSVEDLYAFFHLK
jgi:hypothetical protein